MLREEAGGVEEWYFFYTQRGGGCALGAYGGGSGGVGNMADRPAAGPSDHRDVVIIIHIGIGIETRRGP